METKSATPATTKQDFLFLAALVDGRESMQRLQKRTPHGEALRAAAAAYDERDYVAAYEAFQPTCDKVVADMQRVLSRGLDYEVNKLAKELRKTAAAAQAIVEKKRGHAQQLIGQFDKLRRELENKPLVRAYRRKQNESTAAAASEPLSGAPSTMLGSTSETLVDVPAMPQVELQIGGQRYQKAAYARPTKGAVYCVRDKAKVERIIRVTDVSDDGGQLAVEILGGGTSSKRSTTITAESLARQAATGWCNLLVPLGASERPPAPARPTVVVSEPVASPREQADVASPVNLRLDIQNFSRCCGDIARANIRFDTQQIKDIGDGPFRAGNFDQAFRLFEQAAVGFNSAVSASRRAIADGRRQLNADKNKLSGKEIQERTAAFVRSEQLIHTAEREFATILEGLRMYLRAQQE